MESDLEKELAWAGIYLIGSPGSVEVIDQPVLRSEQGPPEIQAERPPPEEPAPPPVTPAPDGSH